MPNGYATFIITMQETPPALLLAAMNGGVEACRLLLKFGAKISTADKARVFLIH